MDLPRSAEAAAKVVEARYGLPLDLSDAEHLRLVERHYRAKRDAILWESGEAGAYARPDYAKAVLISEAASLALREIAPKRRKHRKDKR
jgi:hypothetical protein